VAVGRHGQKARSPHAAIVAAPLPAQLWLLHGIPVGRAIALLLYNPGHDPSSVRLQASPGVQLSASTARIPPSSSVVIGLYPASGPGSARQGGVLAVATTPILAQWVEKFGNATTIVYGLPVARPGGAPAPSSSG
jgi:hypothetical protein